jgi:hypothetical protein
MAILYILWSIGIFFPVYFLYQEKSGNPGRHLGTLLLKYVLLSTVSLSSIPEEKIGSV